MSDWLDLELSHHLSATAAPDQLWERIVTTPPPRPKPRWPAAAAIIATVVVAAGTLWMVAKGQEPAIDLHLLAAQQLGVQGPLDIQSSNPVEIAAWARREAGVEVNLSPGGSVALAGARIVRQRGECAAAISYRVDGREAALLVARASVPSGGAHGGMAWQSGRQSYALASADASHADAACRICHSSL
jgi:hypothetical protein